MLDDDPMNVSCSCANASLSQCQVHLVSLNNISLERLQPYLEALKPHFDRVLAFRPTGWTYRPPAGTNTLPDVNFVIRRDQGRGFSDISLKPIRGSSRQFMMFGRFLCLAPSDLHRCSIFGAFELLRAHMLCSVCARYRRQDHCHGQCTHRAEVS